MQSTRSRPLQTTLTSTSRSGGQGDVAGDSDQESLPDVTTNNQPDFLVGSYVVALYDKLWYIAQVEGEDPDEEVEGFTLLVYMERRGNNQFIWGKQDVLRTNNKDIICSVGAPVPVSSRAHGLTKEDLAKVKAKMQ